MVRELRYTTPSSTAAASSWSLSGSGTPNVWGNRDHSSQQRNIEGRDGSGYGTSRLVSDEVSDEDIDSFAQHVLEEYAKSSSDDNVVHVDNNLGSYVTNCIREWKCNVRMTHYESIHRMTDYTALCELLQEQCSIDSLPIAQHAIETIAQAVYERRITQMSTVRILADSLSSEDFRIGNTQSTPRKVENRGDATDALKTQQQLAVGIVASPLAADNLIPGDLLEDTAENSDMHFDPVWSSAQSDRYSSSQQQPSTSQTEAKAPTSDVVAFPPLNPTVQLTTSTNMRAPKPKPSSVKTGKGYKSDDLVSTLFTHGPRSRQSSIDDTTSVATNSSPTPSSSPSLHPSSFPSTENATIHGDNQEFHTTRKQQHHLYNQQNQYEAKSYPLDQEHQNAKQLMMLIHHSAEYLVSMNPELSMAAAIAASDMCEGNLGAAHCLINIASTAPPICRHLLNSGCYRADCQFSHDIDSHTCIFWLRGRCSRHLDNTATNSSNACRFLHGFHSKLFQEIPPEYFVVDQNQTAENLYQTEIEAGMYTRDHCDGGQYMNSMYEFELPLDSHGNSVYEHYDTEAWGAQHTAISHSKFAQNPNSFAAIASQGYVKNHSFPAQYVGSVGSVAVDIECLPTVRIPQDLWNPNENRDAAAFHISDPMERYYYVRNSVRGNRDDVVDLHFQSLKTFQVVLDTLLENANIGSCNRNNGSSGNKTGGTWIVTGTGHHIGTQTHQKGGGALEQAVLQFLIDNYSSIFSIYRGRDRNGQSGAVLIVRNESSR